MSTVVSPARLARVRTVDAQGRLGLQYADGGLTVSPIPRPFVGGVHSGFHAAPQVGDFVLVHPEIYGKPNCATSTTHAPAALYPLAPGEVVIIHADGRVACKLANDGTSTLISTPAGASVTIDAAGHITLSTPGRLDLDATGGVFANGQRVA